LEKEERGETMKRRHLFLSATGALLPGLAYAQPTRKVWRIGFLSPSTPAVTAVWHQAFRQGLSDHGWIEGKNIHIEFRFAQGRDDLLADLAAELVNLKVDVIVAENPNSAMAAHKATRTIPIVNVVAGDPVALGLAQSLARPGGNVTGLSTMTFELSGKRLALMKELLPNLNKVAVLWNPLGPASTLNWNEIQQPAKQLGLQLHSMEVRSASDFENAFELANRARATALVVTPDAMFNSNLELVARLARKHRMLSVFHFSEYADAGGFMSYGSNRVDMYRTSATLVHKILNGAKPGDLPIDRAAKFELVLNLKTATAIGIKIPQSILVQADRVIE
jgi:putative ABC transport system substrate-binding protein